MEGGGRVWGGGGRAGAGGGAAVAVVAWSGGGVGGQRHWFRLSLRQLTGGWGGGGRQRGRGRLVKTAGQGQVRTARRSLDVALSVSGRQERVGTVPDVATQEDAAMGEPTSAQRTRAFAMMVGDWRKAAIASGYTLQRVVVVEGVDHSAPKPTLCIRPAVPAGGAAAAGDVTPSHKRARGVEWAAGAPSSAGLPAAAAEREREAAAAAAAYLPSSDDDSGGRTAAGAMATPGGGSASGAGTPATPATGGTGTSGGSTAPKRKGRGSRSGAPKRSHWSDEDHNKLEAGLRKYGWGKFGVIRTEFGLTSRLAASIERYAYRVKKQQPESSLAATWHDSHGKRMRNMENDGAPAFDYLPEGFKPLGAGKRKEATATYIAAAEKAGTLIPSVIIPVEGIMPPPPPAGAAAAAGASGASTGEAAAVQATADGAAVAPTLGGSTALVMEANGSVAAAGQAAVPVSAGTGAVPPTGGAWPAAAGTDEATAMAAAPTAAAAAAAAIAAAASPAEPSTAPAAGTAAAAGGSAP